MASRSDFLPLTVAEVRPEAADVRSLTLRRPDGRPLPDWQPGAHVDVLVPGAGADEVRQYSLCSAPGTDSWRIAVLRERDGRGGSAWLHEGVGAGDTLLVGAPRNTFALREGAGRHVFLAGGIGITPLLPMIAAVDRAGVDWTLLYLATSADRMAFVEELRPYGSRVVLHRDADAGLLDLPPALDRLGAGDAAVYACGPAGLLTAVEDYARTRPGCRLVLERFSGSGSPAAGDADRPFVVETRDGREIPVAAGESVLVALQGAGIPVLTSCREGVCGTCETVVLDGVPDHRDQILSDEERASGETMMVCVSRCLGDRLVLDV